MAPFPAPETGIVLTHFIVTEDIARSREFYANVLGGEIVSESPAVVALANSWIIMNTGGGPTADKPAVTLTAPDPNTTSSFLNVRVANIQEIYEATTQKPEAGALQSQTEARSKVPACRAFSCLVPSALAIRHTWRGRGG
jgi:catechol 2,3-dioxygenase-like lactoylglutathione lyase family enzyme